MLNLLWSGGFSAPVIQCDIEFLKVDWTPSFFPATFLPSIRESVELILEQKQRGPDIRLVMGIVSLALLLRLLFVAQVLRENTPAGIAAFNWDSREYLHLAHNLATQGRYVYDDDPVPAAPAEGGADPDPLAQQVSRQVSHHYGLLRTPGYPVFCAIFEKFGSLAGGVLITQAILGALIPLGVLFLGFALFRNQTAAGGAALLSAISSTGIGLSGMFLVDLLLAVCVLGGFGLLYIGLTRRCTWPYLASGAAFGIGLLVKPSLLYWPVAMVPITLLLAKGLDCEIAWRRLAITAILPWVAAGAWSLRNQNVEGGFTFCSVDAQNLRHFLAPLVEETAKTGHLPAAEDVWKNHYAARNRDWDDMASGQRSPMQITARQRAESLAILTHHPFHTMVAIVKNAFDCSISGWAYTRLQTPSYSPIQRIVHYSNRYLFFFGMFPAYLLMLVAMIEPMFTGEGLKVPENRRRFFLHAALLATLGYFLLISGTSFSTGFRILYPAEFALVLLTVSGAVALVRMIAPEVESEADLVAETP